MAGGVRDGRFDNGVEVAVGVGGGVLGRGVGFFVEGCVGVAVDGGVDALNMLV